jgi:hypothetical protein
LEERGLFVVGSLAAVAAVSLGGSDCVITVAEYIVLEP